jgi:predicted 2-oxoglutarate/Fe(II)-dependent dioxygenase YbiX
MEYILEPALLPDEVLAGAIHVYHNVWTDTDEIIAAIENEATNPDSGLFFDKAMTMGEDWTGPRRNLIMGITSSARRGNQLAQQIHNRYGIILDRALTSYAKKFDVRYTSHEDYGLLKYRGKQREHYDAHYDGGTESGRSISAVFYLNDDYEGGEIEFVHYGVKIKPNAGTLVLFPSNYAYSHIAHEVTDGIKYAIVTWIHDR